MSEESGFFKGQVGASIRLDTEDDPVFLAAATKKEIHYKQQRTGVTGIWTATLDGTKLCYTTSDVDDLPTAGIYTLQVYMEGPGWKIHGKKVDMLVGDPISPVTS